MTLSEVIRRTRFRHSPALTRRITPDRGKALVVELRSPTLGIDVFGISFPAYSWQLRSNQLRNFERIVANLDIEIGDGVCFNAASLSPCDQARLRARVISGGLSLSQTRCNAVGPTPLLRTANVKLSSRGRKREPGKAERGLPSCEHFHPLREREFSGTEGALQAVGKLPAKHLAKHLDWQEESAPCCPVVCRPL
jgi:hypothetical protein